MVDLPFAVQTSIKLAAPGHLLFLLSAEEQLVRDYCGRPDGQGLTALLNSLNNAPFLIENGKKRSLSGTNKPLTKSLGAACPF
ncbi:MAG: hypothetical protein LBD02_03120 [Christensenellaceae bacterium]|nr:hypothetical protein [Christensenellaceae bacterium]